MTGPGGYLAGEQQDAAPVRRARGDVEHVEDACGELGEQWVRDAVILERLHLCDSNAADEDV